MAAPIGNQFWQLRAKHGRDRIIESPEVLWESAVEYFTSVSENPIEAYDNKGTKNVNLVKFIRPFTQKALCIFLDIHEETYRNLKNQEGFFEVTHKVDNIIYNQKFEGAAVGIFQHNIIARDLGLVEKKENDNRHSFEDKAEIASWLDKFSTKINPDAVDKI